jgi:hypothetical protein
MPYSVLGCQERAKECVRLANLAVDQLVRMELLNLRQTYLKIAERLLQQGFELTSPQDKFVRTHEARRNVK